MKKSFRLILDKTISCAEEDFVFFSEFYRDFEKHVGPISLSKKPSQITEIRKCLDIILADKRIKLFNDYYLNGDPKVGFIEYRGSTASKVNFVMQLWEKLGFVEPQIYDVCIFGHHTVDADVIVFLEDKM